MATLRSEARPQVTAMVYARDRFRWGKRLAVACALFDVAVLSAIGVVSLADRTDRTTWADLDRIAGEVREWRLP